METLQIRADYYTDDSISGSTVFFLLPDYKIRVYEECNDLAEKLKDVPESQTCIILGSNGSLNYANGENVRIQYCNSCKKFYFAPQKPRTKVCPFCNSTDAKFLSSGNIIPGWFENRVEKKCIIDQEEWEKHFDRSGLRYTKNGKYFQLFRR